MIVIDQVGEREHACFGEYRALFPVRAGHAGMVIEGVVTDVVELRRMGFPVFARGVCVLSETEAREQLPKVRAALEREAGMRSGFAEEYRRFARGR